MEETESKSSSSTDPMETITIIYAETKVPQPEPEWSSSSTSDTSSSLESFESPVFQDVSIMKDMETSFGYIPIKRTMSTSEGPKMQAWCYFCTHHMFPFFTFLMSHLLAQLPEEPIPFLVSLVDRCVKYRDQDEDPPLLFEDNHVRSVYTALDPMDDGTIEYKQYVNGMITLGLADFNLAPEGMIGKNREVPKSVFINEANIALLKQLDKFIGKTKCMGSASSTKADLYEGLGDLSTRNVTSSTPNITGSNNIDAMKDGRLSKESYKSSSVLESIDKIGSSKVDLNNGSGKFSGRKNMSSVLNNGNNVDTMKGQSLNKNGHKSSSVKKSI